MATKIYKPGDIADNSGQYKNNSTGHEVTTVQGKPLPPTPGKGQTYTLVDKTKHKNNK